jgi:hypothetical protein
MAVGYNRDDLRFEAGVGGHEKKVVPVLNYKHHVIKTYGAVEVQLHHP